MYIVIGLIFLGVVLLTFPVEVTFVFIICTVSYLSYEIYLYFYFKSNDFKRIKESIEEHINNCNDLNFHISELKRTYASIKSFDYGDGRIYDTSTYNYSRKHLHKNIKNHRTHNCSASVCKNASDQPFKYLCKYFDVKVNEKTLSNLEQVLNNFSAAEQGKILLQKERDSIFSSIKNEIPMPIVFINRDRVINKLGFEVIDLSDLYFPEYTFQYVSSGGYSSSKFDIKLDINNLDKFIYYLNEQIKYKQSVNGQRALMTSRLREKIKSRDNNTCQICRLSVYDEKNLLLEIDHIIPLSKGGITSEKNLQTLCWRCNRAKGSKLL